MQSAQAVAPPIHPNELSRLIGEAQDIVCHAESLRSRFDSMACRVGGDLCEANAKALEEGRPAGTIGDLQVCLDGIRKQLQLLDEIEARLSSLV